MTLGRGFGGGGGGTGADGRTWLSGTTAPGSGIGADGTLTSQYVTMREERRRAQAEAKAAKNGTR